MIIHYGLPKFGSLDACVQHQNQQKYNIISVRVSAKILHEIFPVLNCYDEFNIDYCQLVTDTDVAYTITIYVTIYCYIVKRAINY